MSIVGPRPQLVRDMGKHCLIKIKIPIHYAKKY